MSAPDPAPTGTLPDLDALSLPDLFTYLNPPGRLAAWLELVREEDLDAVGDVTSLALVDDDARAEARLRARTTGTIAGLAALPALRAAFDARIEIEPRVADGDAIDAGTELARLSGPLRDLLRIERPLLNLLARLGGVATRTRAFVDAVAGTNARITDTRKTTPGLRGLEKYAVRCGGATLHRIGLHDALLAKDNHLADVPDAGLAIHLADRLADARRRFALRFVEVEVDRLEQFEALLALPEGLVDLVLLDNMDADTLRAAVRRRDETHRDRPLLEASGGITLESVRAVAETGVERIAVGALTHSAPALDLGLDLA